jgi:competence ComEA-like helix-hairpin-helix protein
MDLKEFVKSWLTYSKKDRIGGFIVIAMVLFIFLIPKLLSPKDDDSIAIVPNHILDNAVDSLNTANHKNQNIYGEDEEQPNHYQYEPSQNAKFIEGALFKFDPKSINEAGWKKLGLNDRTIKTINNYRNKGGKFYKPEDLKKIWGLPEAFYNRVEAYIAIETKFKKEYNFQKEYTNTNGYEKKQRTYNTVNINTCDTSALIALPGIGSKLAARIVNFRNKLGGFYSINQVGETYGLPDSTFQKIKSYLNVDEDGIKKTNINSATKDQLKMHPYIKWNLANAIVEYRNQHGNFKSLEDLKNIELIDEYTLQKISPYLTF